MYIDFSEVSIITLKIEKANRYLRQNIIVLLKRQNYKYNPTYKIIFVYLYLYNIIINVFTITTTCYTLLYSSIIFIFNMCSPRQKIEIKSLHEY